MIELFFEDWVCLFEEKKKFEEEVSKLCSSSFVFLLYVVIVLEFYGVCVFEFLGELDRFVVEIVDEGRVDLVMEISMMFV